MAITHVIRGEDHVPNTPKYLLLWEALELGQPPLFAHLPLLVNESRQKLSKRRDKVALEDYRDEGYLPEAMFNYLALLGWSPGGDREILSRQELVDEFRLENVKSSPAFFDQQKLSSVNATYMRALSPDEFVGRANEWLDARWSPIAPLVQERARTLAEVYSMVDFLYLPEINIDEAEWDKVRRQQPAFVASPGGDGGPLRRLRVGGTGDPRGHPGSRCGRRGQQASARLRPPFAWPSPGDRRAAAVRVAGPARTPAYAGPPGGRPPPSRDRGPTEGTAGSLLKPEACADGGRPALDASPAQSANMSLCPFGGGVIGNTTGSGPVIGGSSPPPRATPQS